MSAAAPFRLASHLAAYPEAAFLARLRSGIEDCDASESRRGGDEWRELAALVLALHESALEALHADYLGLFSRAADDHPMSEAEYDPSTSSELADIAGFYLAFGGRQAESGRMIDQLAVELEFYGWLCAREEQLQELGDRGGAGKVRDGRCKFLCEHLGSFTAAVASRPAVARHRFCGPALEWCAGLVRRECRALGVEPRFAAHRRQLESDVTGHGATPQGSGLPVL